MRTLLLLFVISLAILYVTLIFTAPLDLGDEYLAVDNVTVAELSEDRSLLTFFSGGHHVDMIISPEQGLSIGMAIAGFRGNRPMTHDLQVDILRATGTRIIGVSIDSFIGNYFTATLFLRTGPFLSAVDCRPSDCTALALRTGADIYVHQDLLLESIYQEGNISEIIIA